MWTRDSQVWNVLGIVGVLLAVFCATVTVPADYGLSPIVMRWLGLISTLLAATMKLANSYLPGRQQVEGLGKVDVTKLAPVVLLLLTLPFLGACAKKKAVVTLDLGIYTTLAGVQDAEMLLHTSGIINDAGHHKFSTALVPALKAGKNFNAIVRDWPAGTPTPIELATVAADLKVALDDLLAALPQTDQVIKVRLSIQAVAAIVVPFIAAGIIREPIPGV